MLERSERGRRRCVPEAVWCPGVMATCVSSVVCSCAVMDDVADDADRTEQMQEKASVENQSATADENVFRTHAGSPAALMRQPDKSLALLAWTLCLNVFGSGAYSKPAQISLECKHYSLTNDAPSGRGGAAFWR